MRYFLAIADMDWRFLCFNSRKVSTYNFYKFRKNPLDYIQSLLNYLIDNNLVNRLIMDIFLIKL